MFKVAVQVAVLGYAVAVGGGTMAVQVALARRKWLCTGMHWLWRVAVQVACKVAVQVAPGVAANNGCASCQPARGPKHLARIDLID
jgi:hypothetical protein